MSSSSSAALSLASDHCDEVREPTSEAIDAASTESAASSSNSADFRSDDVRAASLSQRDSNNLCARRKIRKREVERGTEETRTPEIKLQAGNHGDTAINIAPRCTVCLFRKFLCEILRYFMQWYNSRRFYFSNNARNVGAFVRATENQLHATRAVSRISIFYRPETLTGCIAQINTECAAMNKARNNVFFFFQAMAFQ